MKLILVTGSMGSGKSSMISYLKKKGYPVFQADLEVRKFLTASSPCFQSLINLFSNKIFCSKKGSFDRKKLAEIVFKDHKKRKDLESLVHPLVKKSFQKFVNTQKKKNCKFLFYEAPLISKKLFHFFDKSFLIVCPKNVKKTRLLKQGWQEEDIQLRWSAQLSEGDVFDKVDFLIDNQNSLKESYSQLEKALKSLK